MIRLLALFQILAIVACRKPNQAKQDSASHPRRRTNRIPQPGKKTGIDEATQIAALIDPEKLGTLKERGENPRIPSGSRQEIRWGGSGGEVSSVAGLGNQRTGFRFQGSAPIGDSHLVSFRGCSAGCSASFSVRFLETGFQ